MTDTQELAVVDTGSLTPDVKVKHAGGRPPKHYYEEDVQTVLNSAAGVAARVLESHVGQAKGQRNLKPSLQRACEYVIDHAIGKAKQKIEHSGGVLTYGMIIKQAEKLEKSSPALLIDLPTDSYQVTPVPEPDEVGKTGSV